MNIEECIIIGRLLEKMKSQKEYSEKLGLSDTSTIHEMRLEKAVGKRQRKDRK